MIERDFSALRTKYNVKLPDGLKLQNRYNRVGLSGYNGDIFVLSRQDYQPFTAEELRAMGIHNTDTIAMQPNLASFVCLASPRYRGLVSTLPFSTFRGSYEAHKADTMRVLAEFMFELESTEVGAEAAYAALKQYCPWAIKALGWE